MFKLDKEMRESSPPESFDNTVLTSFDKCNRALYWFLRGVDYLQTPAYFTWGRAWQEGLEAWYCTEGSTTARATAGLVKACLAWEEDSPVEKGNDTLENLKFLLLVYFFTYPSEKWEVIKLQQDGGIHMELGFQFPFKVGAQEVVLSGAIDGYITWPGQGFLVLENKTSGPPLNEQNIAQWSWSSQVTQYIWALRQIHGDKVLGTLMNLAHKNLLVKEKEAFKKNKTIPENKFARDLQKRSPWQIEEYLKETSLTIQNIWREWERWLWPKTREHLTCVGGYGRTACPYRWLCQIQIPFGEIEDPAQERYGLKWREQKWEPWNRGSRRRPKKDELQRVTKREIRESDEEDLW